MKKIIMFFCCMLFITGCKKNNSMDILNEMTKKIDNCNSYQMVSKLEIYRNEEKFTYDIVSTYKKDNLFKVQLTNKNNNHEQLILKNNDSVYVLTPSLNKSFKFQSEWPYNNSQIYLLQPILMDIKNDEKKKIEQKEENYIITSEVNYLNEKDYKKQKVYIGKDKNINKVEILDTNNVIKMSMEVVSIKYDIDLKNDFFEVEKYINNENSTDIQEKQTSTIEEIIYPMYVPEETYLTSQEVINKENGERVILTFSGKSNFTLIQENLDNSKNIDYVYGDPYLILDTIGSLTDSSISWISNNMEYTVVSDNVNIDELLTVAQSISVQPVGK